MERLQQSVELRVLVWLSFDMICMDLSIMHMKLMELHPAKMGFERPVASASTFITTPHLDPRVRSLPVAKAALFPPSSLLLMTRPSPSQP